MIRASELARQRVSRYIKQFGFFVLVDSSKAAFERAITEWRFPSVFGAKKKTRPSTFPLSGSFFGRSLSFSALESFNRSKESSDLRRADFSLCDGRQSSTR
jgi:hypothetical protein